MSGRHRLLPGDTLCDPESFKRGLKAHRGEYNLIGPLGWIADATPDDAAQDGDAPR